jgi:hypothetical protein
MALLKRAGLFGVIDMPDRTLRFDWMARSVASSAELRAEALKPGAY